MGGGVFERENGFWGRRENGVLGEVVVEWVVRRWWWWRRGGGGG